MSAFDPKRTSTGIRIEPRAPASPCRDVAKDSIFTQIQSQKPDGRNSMHYKPKSIGALHIALGGLPGICGSKWSRALPCLQKPLANSERRRRGPRIW